MRISYNLIMGVLMALIVIFSVIQTFQINTLKIAVQNSITSNSVTSIDTSTWTEDEKMNYEHHGVLPSRVKGAGQEPSMVGGC